MAQTFSPRQPTRFASSSRAMRWSRFRTQGSGVPSLNTAGGPGVDPPRRMPQLCSHVRYFFSNVSSAIRQIFCKHCELLEIRVTQPNHRNLAVSHRASVAILDTLIGPTT